MMEWLTDLFIEDAKHHSPDEQVTREMFDRIMETIEDDTDET